MFFKVVTSAILLLSLQVLAADAGNKTQGEALERANQLMAERAERVIKAHGMEQELEGAWGDERYQSPEVAELRAKYLELLQELTAVQALLREKVKELPTYKNKSKELKKEREKINELQKEAQRHMPQRE